MDYNFLGILIIVGVSFIQVNSQQYKCSFTNENIENFWKGIVCKNATLNDLILFLEKFPFDDNILKHPVSISFQESHITSLTASSEFTINSRYAYMMHFHYENNDIDNVYINVTQGLKNNRIENIKNTQILINKNIDLSHNVIRKITHGTFWNLKTDRILLTSCELTEVESNSFTNIRDVRLIDLSRNNISRISKNTFVQILQTSFIIFKYYSSGLDLSHNQINFIEPSSFVNSSTIDMLNLSNNNLTVFNTNWFRNIPVIKSLDLEHNQISKIITESSNDNGTVISISDLNLAFNQIEFIQATTFTRLPDLHGLNLESNPIKTIEPYSFQSLASIWEPEIYGRDLLGFSLGKLNISSIGPNTFDGLKSITTLNLAEWNINNIEPFAFSDCSALKRLFLSHNNLSSIKANTFASLDHLKILDLSYNRLTTIEKNYFEGLTITEPSEHLNEFKSSDNQLGSLIYLQLKPLERSQIELNLAHNQIESIQVNAFQHISGVEIINLSGNNLKNLSIGTFKGLQYLTKLDLSFNKISQLNKEVLYPLGHLVELNIANNNLVSLDMRDLLIHFAKDVFQSININDNLWDCDHLSEMVRHLSDNKVDFTSSNPEHFHSENVHGIACYQPETKELFSDNGLELEFLQYQKTIALSSQTHTTLLILIVMLLAIIFILNLISCLTPMYTRFHNLRSANTDLPSNSMSQSTLELINVTN